MVDPARVEQPPYVAPPRGATYVDKFFAVQSAVSGGTTRQLFIPTGELLLVPAGRELRVARLGFGAMDPTALVYATYTINQNGNPLEGFTANTVAIGTLDVPGEVFLHVLGPSELTVFVTNGYPSPGAIATFYYTARLVGWQYQAPRAV